MKRRPCIREPLRCSEEVEQCQLATPVGLGHLAAVQECGSAITLPSKRLCESAFAMTLDDLLSHLRAQKRTATQKPNLRRMCLLDDAEKNAVALDEIDQ